MKKSDVLSSVVLNILKTQIDMDNRDIFIRNLLFVKSVIVASEKITNEAANYCADLKVKNYFIQHAEEESGHYEWLSRDLDGYALPLMAEAAGMAGSQYFLIYHFDPVSVLGYMAVLEFFPMSLDRVKELEELHGKKLCQTLRYHAEHDIAHGNDLREIIDGLTDEQFVGVLNNAMQTAYYLDSAFRKLS